MNLGGGLHPINTFTHLGDVKIDLHYSLLVPETFDQDCEIGLEPFADHGLVRKQKDILGCLLGDRAASTATLPALIFLPGLSDRLPVKTIVPVEEVVLAGYDGAGHLRGYSLVGHPGLAGAEILVAPVLDGSLDHERRDIDRTPSQDQDPQEGHGNEGQRQLDKKKPPESSQ